MGVGSRHHLVIRSSVIVTRINSVHIGRSLGVWLLIVLAETIHGIVRQLFLVDLVGDFRARQIGVFTGSLIILVIATVTIKWLGANTTKQQFAVGIIWVVLIVAFEVSLGLFLHYTPERILSDYDLPRGGLMGLGLLVMLCAPYLAARARRFGI